MMKRLFLKILGSLVILSIIFNSTIVMAANVDDLKSQQKENDNKINQTQSQINEINAKKSQTVKEVEALNDKISGYESEILELQTKISNLNNQINEKKIRLKEAEDNYDYQQEMLNKRLVAIQEAGETSYLDFLLSSNGIVDFISNYYLITELAKSDTQLLESIEQQKVEITKQKEDLESNKNEVVTAKASVESVQTQLKSTKSEKDKQVAQLSASEKELQSQIDELRSANISIDAKIQAEIRKATNNNKNGGNVDISSPSAAGFIYPLPTAYSRITTGINYSTGQYHGAVDFGCSGINGQPIYAVADGTVMISERLNGSYGNYILIYHNNGLFSLYAHGQDGSRTVSAGQTVKRGQQIMRVGSTGNSTGPHLHFEVRTYPGSYSNRVNPISYLP
ncbi:MAG: peptidoglycan DD-metalloendopeptidase family protein [Clostridia bacterium]|nr:peptidoglycan DD-metalloendopeptidase family protein [Clostridia bacterium]